jgi:hypothetical protein
MSGTCLGRERGAEVESIVIMVKIQDQLYSRCEDGVSDTLMMLG